MKSNDLAQHDRAKQGPNGDASQTPDGNKRTHRATYATDKRKGGYLVRVVGPYADRFAGREVPVTRKDNSEHMEKLTRLLWSGQDDTTKQPCALYAFEARPRERLDDEIPF